MPKRGAIAVTLTAFALVLLLNFQAPGGNTTPGLRAGATGAPASVANVGGSGSASPPPGRTSRPEGPGASPAGSSNGPGPSPTASGGPGTAGTRTLTGATVDTRWGPVQVAVTFQGRRIVEITALQLPSGGRSGRISSFAVPILHDQALQAQSATIDGVSGATYTSTGYEQSLQAALDSAGA